MLVWAEPFTRLRLPKIYNLRADPYEFADVISNTYRDWMINDGYISYGMLSIINKWTDIFKDFPPIQKPNTFTFDDAKICSMHLHRVAVSKSMFNFKFKFKL